MAEATPSSCESGFGTCLALDVGFSSVSAEPKDLFPIRAPFTVDIGEDIDIASALSLSSSSFPIRFRSSPTFGKDIMFLTLCGTPPASIKSRAGVQLRASSAAQAAV